MNGRPLKRYAIIVGVVLLTAGADLWTKRWAEDNLASDRHLLPVHALEVAEGTTRGDVVRARFPELTDEDLTGRLFKVDRSSTFSAEDPVFDLQTGGAAMRGFYVFDEGDLQSFARRIHRLDDFAIQRWINRARPDMDRSKVSRKVKEHLAGVTLTTFLAERLPHLDEDTVASTIERGLFGYGGNRGMVQPGEPAEKGDVYLVSSRDVALLPGYLEFNYVENPAGAWGILGGVDEGARRMIFFVLSIVAILVVVFLIIRPPTDKVLPLVALGGILGGAIGNLVDRLTLTYVVDFIHMHWQDAVVNMPLLGPIRMDWPRYNIADIGITVGVIVLLFATGFVSPEKKVKGDLKG
ncbi:MAG: signal peptidase II [Deltaproteobacteria bacterium]|nr:signal peptidase II [Deltaproteobacteria bacterium]